MENNIAKLVYVIKNKYELLDTEIERKLVLVKSSNGKLLVGLMFNSNKQDKDFYLFDAMTMNDLFSQPIAQIKFMTNEQSIFIRRLEYLNQSSKGKGYATCLLQSFEKFCAKNGYKSITGELIPLHNENPTKVKNFYLRNGYTIALNQDNQEIIKKNILPIKNRGIAIIDFAKAEENIL